jgi:type II secretory pathway component HofQ
VQRAVTSAAVLALVALVAGLGSAHATPGEMCRPGAKYRGALIDMDVKDADIHDVLRLLSDVGRVNIVVADAVRGRVTLRLKRVAWDQVACTIAAIHKLSMVVDGNIVLVRPRVK